MYEQIAYFRRMIAAAKRRTKRNTQRRPTMSPARTKKVWREDRFTIPFSTAGSHQAVRSRIRPFWSIKAEMPVFPHRAMSRRVSMARSRA